MATGAATQKGMNKLHARLAGVMARTLEVYLKRMDFLEKIEAGDTEGMNDMLEEGVLASLFDDDRLPSPAMLAAVANFLKANSITCDPGELEEVSGLQKRLEARAKDRRMAPRPQLVSVSNLKVEADED